ncbi:MAG: hypothetical protein DRP35_11305 [Candidatus Zixiibacteriota bacterium]|nr:MAG: hypothetical protein DRP35_11305 [candidate division Zixibacteria bacterium]
MKNDTSKKKQLADVLEKLKKEKNYFSYEEIKSLLKKAKIEITLSSLKSYVFELVKNKVIFDAGKGWYSSIEKPFELNTNPVKSIIKIIKKEFPLLDFSCWSTEQLNSFTHHLLSKFIIFVYTDSDYISNPAEILRNCGYNVYENPNKAEIEKSFRITEKTVVLLPSIKKQPQANNNCAPIEKILIDFLMENRHYKIMENSEAEAVVVKAVNSDRVNISKVFSYAKERKFPAFSSTNYFRLNEKGGNG